MNKSKLEEILELGFPRGLMSDERLQLQNGEQLGKPWVEGRLGQGMYHAYLYIHPFSEGKRRYCDVSEETHWFETSERANLLDESARKLNLPFRFGTYYTTTSLFHDIVNDTCKTLEQAHNRLDEIKQFGSEIAYNVEMVSNFYSTIIDSIESKTKSVEATRYSKDILRKAMEEIEAETDEEVKERFKKEIEGVKGIIEHTDIRKINAKIKKDEDVSIFDEMKLEGNEYHIADLFKDAYQRFNKGDDLYDVGIVVEGLNIIDNLRTTTQTNQRKLMEKRLGKIDVFLDRAESFIEMPGLIGKNQGFEIVYTALKGQVVDQLVRGRIGLVVRDDTNFYGAEQFFDEKIDYYSSKFGIDPEPVKNKIAKETVTEIVNLTSSHVKDDVLNAQLSTHE
ncbi:MAG: hypothetical protein GY861_09115 [bacterium]|nr:hypothetical protein [bacterium]